ncbi:hypothetical protein [Deinococcus multiflagellatus]|uniref:Uncharacterized protein n=1 Tax=Deinococcus multiflagellatus TaxID=1656887 RepID=A0ABW1ZUC4_9DEIO
MTLRKVVLQPSFDPRRWDTDLNALDWREVVATLNPLDARTPALRVLAINTSRDAALIEEALATLTPSGLSRGAQLMALSQLGRHAEVLALAHDTMPAGSTEEALFDAANASFAVAMAAAVSNDLPLAQTQLHAARLLTAALQMPARLQLVALEHERVKAALGQGDVNAIQQVMNMLPMPDRRRDFANGIKADVYFCLGDYDAARRMAPRDSRGLIASALLDLPFAEETLAAVSPTSLYLQLAEAIRDPQRPVPLPTQEPYATYARLLRVCRLLQQPGGAAQAVPLLAAITPIGADQQVMLGALLIAARVGAPAPCSPRIRRWHSFAGALPG